MDVEAWELRVSAEEIQHRIATSYWWEPVIHEFDKQMQEHCSPEKFMQAEWPEHKLMEWATLVNGYFPPTPGTSYMKDTDDDWKPGRKLFRCWEVSWKMASGNAGFVSLEKFRNLFMLVLAYGPETNPEIPGTELPIITKPDVRFTDGTASFMGIAAPDGIESPGVHGIHTVKSYKRFLAINMVIAILHKTNTMESYKATQGVKPGFLERFAVMHGHILDRDVGSLIDVNRGSRVRYRS